MSALDQSGKDRREHLLSAIPPKADVDSQPAPKVNSAGILEMTVH
jgi:hypothetical protein